MRPEIFFAHLAAQAQRTSVVVGEGDENSAVSRPEAKAGVDLHKILETVKPPESQACNCKPVRFSQR